MYLPSGLNTTPSGKPPTSSSCVFVTFLPSIFSTATLPALFANHAFFGAPALPFRRIATAISPVGLIARPSVRRRRREIDHAHRVDVTVGRPRVAVVGGDGELAVRGDVDVVRPEAHRHVVLPVLHLLAVDFEHRDLVTGELRHERALAIGRD